MPWEMDVRKGTATVGTTKREGFSIMRDRARRLIVFHVRDQRLDQHIAESPVRVDEQFVLTEDVFEPA
jgi:hypothetical protein